MKNEAKEKIDRVIEVYKQGRIQKQAAGIYVARILAADVDLGEFDSYPDWLQQELRDISKKYTEVGELFEMGAQGLVDISEIGEVLTKLLKSEDGAGSA